MRRRLLVIRPSPNLQAGPMAAATTDRWIEALRLNAEVLALDREFDLAAVSAAFRPDMIIFGTLDRSRPWPVRIGHRQACPDIPRVLFLHSDPHDPMRGRTLAIADEHGVEAIFVTAEAVRQLTPELRHRPVHVIDQFVDASDFQDPGLPKTIPVSVFGNSSPDVHPWQVRVVAALDRVLPVMTFPHQGYAARPPSSFTIAGSAYARMIGRSSFVIADTSRLDQVLPRHLAIPACGSVLVAPDTAALARYGFIDGENCVLGSGSALADKVAALARDQQRYDRICKAGQDLVHRRFTGERWTGFLDWLESRSASQAAGMVTQTGLSSRPARTTGRQGGDPQQPGSFGDNQVAHHLAAVRDAILCGEGLEAAQGLAQNVARWVGAMAEPQLLLGMLALLRGDAATAIALLSRRATSVAAIGRACAVLDPVEVAWLLVIAHLRGDAATEANLRLYASELRHVSLRRALWFADGAPQDGVEPDTALLERRADDHISLHWLGDEDFTRWSDLMMRVVVANHLSALSGARSPARPPVKGLESREIMRRDVAA